MFTKLDPNSQLQSMFQVVKAIRIKRNPLTSRPLITNVWTQILANRILTFTAEWKQAGVKAPIQIELVNFAPSRNPKTGEYSKDLTPVIKSGYERGLDAEVAMREFGYLLSYFTACFATGMLPTPTKPSGQSTIMAGIVRKWRDDNGLSPNWIEIVGKNGVTMRLTSAQIDPIQTIFVNNYDTIVQTWDTGDSRPDVAGNQVEWI